MVREKTCILIDDDEDDHRFFTAALQGQLKSIHCIHYFRPKEALEKILQNIGVKPSLIFIDLNMPQLNGLECLRILKETPALSDIPVVIYSTSSNARDVAESKKLGALAYIVKPNNIEDLITRLSGFF